MLGRCLRRLVPGPPGQGARRNPGGVLQQGKGDDRQEGRPHQRPLERLPQVPPAQRVLQGRAPEDLCGGASQEIGEASRKYGGDIPTPVPPRVKKEEGPRHGDGLDKPENPALTKKFCEKEESLSQN